MGLEEPNELRDGWSLDTWGPETAQFGDSGRGIGESDKKQNREAEEATSSYIRRDFVRQRKQFTLEERSELQAESDTFRIRSVTQGLLPSAVLTVDGRQWAPFLLTFPPNVELFAELPASSPSSEGIYFLCSPLKRGTQDRTE